MKHTIDPIFTYNDYRKFIRFVNNQFELPINHFNPLELFKIENFNNPINMEDFVNSFFKGNRIIIPEFKTDNNEINTYSRFEDFTSRDEVNNISLWGLSALSMLSNDANVRLGKELEILQENNPRDGRLDITILNYNDLLILESKVTLKYSLSEARFKYQISEYKNQAIRIVKENNLPYSVNAYLFVGGEESDLFPPNHPACTTGKVGNIAQIFYDNMRQHKLKFISANALWCLLNYGLCKNKNINLLQIVSILNEDNVVGLLSAGKVIFDNNEILIKELNL